MFFYESSNKRNRSQNTNRYFVPDARPTYLEDRYNERQIKSAVSKEKEGKKRDENETKKKNSSWFSRQCQGANGMIGERSRGRMVSGIQAFSRRHVRRKRQGTDTYYKSSRGPSAKEMSVAKNEGKRCSAGGRRKKDRIRGGVRIESVRSRSYITAGIYEVPP